MFAEDLDRTSPALSLMRSEWTLKRRSMRSIRESKKAGNGKTISSTEEPIQGSGNEPDESSKLTFKDI